MGRSSRRSPGRPERDVLYGVDLRHRYAVVPHCERFRFAGIGQVALSLEDQERRGRGEVTTQLKRQLAIRTGSQLLIPATQNLLPPVFTKVSAEALALRRRHAMTRGLRLKRGANVALTRLARFQFQRQPEELTKVIVQTETLTWSAGLIRLVISEFNVEEEVQAALGPLTSIPRARLPQALAVALAARYRWRPDLLKQLHRAIVALPRRRP